MEMTYVVPAEISVVDGKTKEKVQLKTRMKGTIIMDVPGYEESTDIALEFSTEAQAQEGETKKVLKEGTVKKIMSLCNKYVKKVDVKSLDGKYTFTQLSDLSCVKEGRALINDLFETLISGFQLGKD